MLVAWDTLEVPTYRHNAFDAYQSGRIFEDSLLEQLAILPAAHRGDGASSWAKAPATKPTTSSPPRRRRAWPGDVLVATSDRDAYQLANDRVTILAPTRGVSEIARIGPAEVRERYGVDPEQVPDLIALRGDPSDKLPGRPRDRAEEGGGAPWPVPDARGRARRRTIRGRGGGLAPLPANRAHGRLRSPSSPQGQHPNVGGGVLLPQELGLATRPTV